MRFHAVFFAMFALAACAAGADDGGGGERSDAHGVDPGPSGETRDAASEIEAATDAPSRATESGSDAAIDAPREDSPATDALGPDSPAPDAPDAPDTHDALDAPVDTACASTCTAGDKKCDGDAVRACVSISTACYDWSSAVPCASGEKCTSGVCKPSCVPYTCASWGDPAKLCGTFSDGCGGLLTCNGGCWF